ncbi:MAG: 50S ribosomal protein L23 [Chlorobiaceae bacterium]|nr:50S ribosomal protein L23 [Chlorobiaceae bacterium]MBA4310151.1 50S ribosomal protein L23 [Chlorobiaceae bacterium]
MRNVLIKPLFTEKMTNINAAENKYGFIVLYDANKIEIAAIIKKKFNVNVTDVNTIRFKGKSKTQFTKRGRFSGRTSRYKKAIVTLKSGEKIEIFEQA